MKKSSWIWYPGDYEIYHALLVNTRRQERDYDWPAFWRLDDVWHNVRFRKTVEIAGDTWMSCRTNGRGYLQIDGRRMSIEKKVLLSQGRHELFLCVYKNDGLPCIYVEGNGIQSNSGWEVDCCDGNWKPAGYNKLYRHKTDNPEIFPMQYKQIKPVKIEKRKNGILYDFGRETFAALHFTNCSSKTEMGIYYGEWEKEALDTENCYFKDEFQVKKKKHTIPAKAFRYLFIKYKGSYDLDVQYEYISRKQRAVFCCSDKKLNEIWNTAEYTFELNSREFFLDGIKRDRWIWSGDAYQSYQINNYLYYDQEITKRTIVALRGKDPVTMHMNSIPDYSFYWLMSIYEYYQTTQDKEFVQMIYERMKSLMDFCIERTNAIGFVEKADGDWIFIDWADIDKEGAVCAEQMLYTKSLEAMAACAKIVGEDFERYHRLAKEMREKIQIYFWREEKGAFIDSYQSGKENVTRHANIFAILYGFVTDKQRESIVNRVILNSDVPEIKTPYFKFYELDLMGQLGKLDNVKKQIEEYWGGMLKLGATTFWEEYDPRLNMEEQYKMYDNPYGKSFCHAWGASPIYLIGKYFLGIRQSENDPQKVIVEPQVKYFQSMNARVPVLNGEIKVSWNQEKLYVMTTQKGCVVKYHENTYELKSRESIEIILDR